MNAVELTDLTKHYRDFTLDRVSLMLPEGCVMGLVGENGAGKTTAIKLLLGMLKRDGGAVRVLGRDMDTDGRAVKEELGVVLDEAGFPECVTARQAGRIMAAAYQNWDARAYDENLKKLSLPENKPFKDFSRGMKMKLSLAVALSHNARLLVLDEALNGIDPVARDEILDIFMDYTRDEGHSILLSSHIVSDLEKVCDYIAFLHRGKLMLCDEKDALLEKYGLIHVSREQLAELDGAAIKGSKSSPYGVEAVVERSRVPAGMQISPVGLEELFVYMARGDR